MSMFQTFFFLKKWYPNLATESWCCKYISYQNRKYILILVTKILWILKTSTAVFSWRTLFLMVIASFSLSILKLCWPLKDTNSLFKWQLSVAYSDTHSWWSEFSLQLVRRHARLCNNNHWSALRYARLTMWRLTLSNQLCSPGLLSSRSASAGLQRQCVAYVTPPFDSQSLPSSWTEIPAGLIFA